LVSHSNMDIYCFFVFFNSISECMRFDSLLSPNWDDAVLEYSTILECMLNRALKKKRKEERKQREGMQVPCRVGSAFVRLR